MDESTVWNGLTIRRRKMLSTNWNYRVAVDDRAYIINIFNPGSGRMNVAVWRRLPRHELLVRQWVDVANPEAAMRFCLEIVRGVHQQPVPVPEEPLSRPEHYAHATFRLSGHALDPDEITTQTGLQPTSQLPAPEVLRLKHLGPWRDGMWFLESKGHVDSPDLAEHIRWLLDRIEPVQDRFPPWVEPPERWDSGDDHSFYAVILCWRFGDSPDQYLDPHLIRRLADLRLGLSIDIDGPDDRDEDEGAIR